MRKLTKPMKIGICSVMGVIALVVLITLTAPSKPDLSHNYYDSAVTTNELDDKLKSGEPRTVYFYDPDCKHCQSVTPVIFPLAKSKDIELIPYDITEQPFAEYQLTGTPTLVHFDAYGKEVDRMVGEYTEDDYAAFFDQIVLETSRKTSNLTKKSKTDVDTTTSVEPRIAQSVYETMAD